MSVRKGAWLLKCLSPVANGGGGGDGLWESQEGPPDG